MQKIFHFELGMAIKDRPKAFQVVTLVLFAFSLMMILLGAIVRLSDSGGNQQALQKKQTDHFVRVTPSYSLFVTPVQK